MTRFHFVCLTFVSLILLPSLTNAQDQPAVVTVAAANPSTPELSDHFLGLSYEMLLLNPQDGHYYFDPSDAALVNTFKTLGIKSLRVGANAVDNPKDAVPQEKDIDVFFQFARSAGVKVIYSFRLKNGNPADSARLASYIAAHDADALDAFSIGNEPNFYLHKFDEFFAQWKPHYDAILQAVPHAMFDGPSVAGQYAYVQKLADALYGDGHLSMLSDHYYFLGSGRAGEKNPPETRARFLSNDLHQTYEKNYAGNGAPLAARGIPYRIDELNSCYNGGSKDSSDTYASTLWALDCTHWWAAHHILGMNYHTGEFIKDGVLAAQNYSAFLHQPDRQGIILRPQAYAYMAFSQAAHGRPLDVTTQADPTFNFNAYAYQDRDGSYYLTLINKSYGDQAHPASVSLQLPTNSGTGSWQRLDLTQKDQDVSAKSDVLLGGQAVNSQGLWTGSWKKIDGATSSTLKLTIAPASASLLHFVPTS